MRYAIFPLILGGSGADGLVCSHSPKPSYHDTLEAVSRSQVIVVGELNKARGG